MHCCSCIVLEYANLLQFSLVIFYWVWNLESSLFAVLETISFCFSSLQVYERSCMLSFILVVKSRTIIIYSCKIISFCFCICFSVIVPSKLGFLLYFISHHFMPYFFHLMEYLLPVFILVCHMPSPAFRVNNLQYGIFSKGMNFDFHYANCQIWILFEIRKFNLHLYYTWLC